MHRTAPASQRPCCATHPLASRIEALAASYLFRDLPPVVLQDLVAKSRWLHVERHECVFRVGDEAHSLYVVHDGQLKDRLLTADGGETVTELLIAPAVFGEPGLFAPERSRVVDVVALETTHVIAITRPVVIRTLERHPPVAMRLIEALSMEWRAVTNQLANAGYLRVRDRLITVLLDLATSHGVADGTLTRISLSLNQSLLAGMIAATRENVSRALTDLSGAGAIHARGSAYRVDPAVLRELINADLPTARRNRVDS